MCKCVRERGSVRERERERERERACEGNISDAKRPEENVLCKISMDFWSKGWRSEVERNYLVERKTSTKHFQQNKEAQKPSGPRRCYCERKTKYPWFVPTPAWENIKNISSKITYRLKCKLAQWPTVQK